MSLFRLPGLPRISPTQNWTEGQRVDLKSIWDDLVRLSNSGSSSYTPVHTNLVNLSATTPHPAVFMRVGGAVMVFGGFSADPVAGAPTDTSFEMSLPIPSVLASADQLSGMAATPAVAGQVPAIYGVVANGTAKVQWQASDTANRAFSFQFAYPLLF
jgi:hypothetical protein